MLQPAGHPSLLAYYCESSRYDRKQREQCQQQRHTNDDQDNCQQPSDKSTRETALRLGWNKEGVDARPTVRPRAELFLGHTTGRGGRTEVRAAK